MFLLVLVAVLGSSVGLGAAADTGAPVLERVTDAPLPGAA
jgi:hypothetical protein